MSKALLLVLVSVLTPLANGIQMASNTSPHAGAAEQTSPLRTLGEDERKTLLAAREAVWRAWFAGDTEALRRLVPPELITLEPDAETFGTLASNLEGSRGFAASGEKLARLAFPRTEFQAYGNTVIVYTSYEIDIVSGGRTRTDRGLATEVFVQHNGRWLNTGWQLSAR